METPETHYAHSGDVNIAYQVLGDGPFDLVFVPGSISHVELVWQVPAWAAFNRRLASFSRLILLDKRGTGMSDRVPGAPTLETRMDDVRAVMDAVGSERAALLGLSEGGSMSALFAATYPDRTWALVLCGALPRTMWAPDYPWGSTEEDYRRESEEEDRRWGEPTFMKEVVRGLAPSLDEGNLEALATLFRQSASPGAIAALNQMNMEIDIRDVLPAIRVPTLIVNRAEEPAPMRDGSRFIASHVPGARHVEFPGPDHAPFAGDADSYVEEIERFLNETWAERAWEDTEQDRRARDRPVHRHRRLDGQSGGAWRCALARAALAASRPDPPPAGSLSRHGARYGGRRLLRLASTARPGRSAAPARSPRE